MRAERIRRRLRPWRGIALILLFNAAFATWLLLKPADRHTIVAVDDVASWVGPLLAALAIVQFQPGRRAEDSATGQPAAAAAPSASRRAPLLLALGVLSFAVGQALWTVYEVILRQAPFPSLADVAYLAKYPFLLAGILLLSRRSLSANARLRVVVDGLLIMTGVATCSWYFILGPTLAHGGETPLARIVGTAYPLCDLVLVGCLCTLWIGGRVGAPPRAAALLSLGLGLVVVADSIFDYQNVRGTFATGAIVDTFWPLGYMLVALGAATAARATVAAVTPQPDRQQDGVSASEEAALPFWQAALPYAVVPAVAAVLAYASFVHSPEHPYAGGVYAGAAILVVLILLRQVLMMLDNRSLYGRLTSAYAAQGADLAHRMEELEWLRAMSQRLTVARTLDAVLDAVYEGIREGMHYDRVGINLFDHEAGIFEDCIGTDALGQKTTPVDRVVHLDPDSPIWRFPGIAALLRGVEFYYTHDAFAECPPELRYLFDGAPTHNLMVPLHTGERVTGMISVDNLLSGRPITPADAGPLLALANQVGTAVENARLLAREHDERARLEALATTDPLTGLPNHRALVASLDHELERAHRYRRPCAALLIDLDHFKALNDGYGHPAGDAALREFGAVVRRALRAVDIVGRWGGEEFLVLLPETDVDGAVVAAETVRAAVAAHTFAAGGGGHLTCSIGVAAYPADGLSRDALVAAADQAMYAAKALGRNQARAAADRAVTALLDETRADGSREEAALVGIVEALAALVEARDRYTGQHTRDVAALTRRVALALGLDAAHARMVGLAGQLHDIGKVAVPETVLRKPGRLTAEEWTAIYRHPSVGADVVGRVPALRPLAPLIRAHHERWDGQGYPDRLAGEMIPLGARIVAVADAYAAMVADRPYRAACTAEWALEELRRCAGAQFDPAVVAALEQVLAADPAT